jgi:neutral ceramidase
MHSSTTLKACCPRFYLTSCTLSGMEMKNVVFVFRVVLVASMFLSLRPAEAQSGPGNSLVAGTAKVNITPGTPIPMSGYGGRDEPFKGVHDDLFARVVVFSDGKNKAALIATDLIGISNDFWRDVTDALEKRAGIRKEFVLLSAVHNHNGPVTNVYNESTSPDVLAYIAELKEKIIGATRDAMNRMVPVRIGAGKGVCKMNINRRAQDGKGEITLGMNPYGPCDHEVGVIRIEDKSGKPLSIMVNWPCHGVVLGPKNYLITGDWPGAAASFIEKAMGENVVAPITIGASGDINPLYGPHIDFESNNSYAFGKDAIGEDLAKESVRVAKDLTMSSAAMIRASQRVISLPAKAEGDSLKVRLSAVKIGPIVLAGVSGEVFNEISVRMRAQSPYAFTFMITHCNGSSGYLVTDAAYAQGGYEVNSTLAKSGAEKAIVSQLLAMINEL